MTERLDVIYNGRCPICSAEITAYRRHAHARGLPIGFTDLHETELTRHGLTRETAARRLYVVRDGQLHAGLDAFLRLWEAMPRYRWLACAVDRRGVRPFAGWLYERIAAPALFALHRRRMRRHSL